METERKNAPFVKSILIPGMIALVLLCGAFTGGYLLFHRGNTAVTLPSRLSTRADFTIYTPTKLPNGYTYLKDSASMQQGVLFYRLVNEDKIITVSQQTKPSGTNFDTIVGLNPVSIPLGPAHLGKNGSAPTMLITTSKTLITLTGTADVGENTLTEIAKKLTPTR